jgi:hypothetical protein
VRQRLRLVLLLSVAPLVLGGCLGVETTQEKSAARAKKAVKALKAQKGLKIAHVNPDVKVETSAVIQDPNGVAAVLRVRNTGGAQAQLPVAISVADAKGKKLYANDAPGLDPSLVSLPVLGKGQEAYWVNNQILTSGKASKVQAVVGAAKQQIRGAIPKITLAGIHYDKDEDGVFAKGTVSNDSPVLQRRLVIACVARAGDKVIAAGRAIVDKLPPAAQQKKPTFFTVYFIGDPKGARLDCAAPPTVLPGGAAK